MMGYVGVVFFVKQKTANEVRFSDWSSDVCSSDRCGGCLGSRERRGRIAERGEESVAVLRPSRSVEGQGRGEGGEQQEERAQAGHVRRPPSCRAEPGRRAASWRRPRGSSLP